MPTPSINSHRQLREHLQLLEEKEKFYRMRLMSDGAEIIQALKDPVPLIKRTVKSLAADSDFRADLLSIGLNHLVKFLSRKFGENEKWSGWLNTIIKKFRGETP